MQMSGIENFYPLSPMQQGMLFHSLLAPESGVFVEQAACMLRGGLDVEIFRQAWQKAAERHPILRTGFVFGGLREPVQVVHKQVAIQLEEHDWTHLAPTEQQQRRGQLLQEQREKGFPLTQPPLMRLLLIRLAPSAHEFVWTYHHALLDGWSIPLLLHDVLASYEAITQGRAPQLPPIRPYRDYIAWLKKQDAGAAESFWRRTLQGFTAATALPQGHGAAAGSSADLSSYTRRELRLAPDTTARLRTLAREQHITLNTLVQGAWALLLARYSGEDDVVFGATVSGRPPELPGVESMVGLFVNTLPVRVRIAPETSVAEWLKRLQAEQIEARQFEYTPLVQVLGWSSVPRGQPLFESLVVFENTPASAALKERGWDLQMGSAKGDANGNGEGAERTVYPLTLVASGSDDLVLFFDYDRDRYAPEQIDRLLKHLVRILEAFAADAQRPLGEISLLGEPERQRVLWEWNRTDAPLPEACIHELFQEQVARTPDAVALRFGERTLTYGELDREANRLAHALRRRGVGPDTLVGLCVERSVELVVGILATLKAGGAYVPLDPAYPEERLAFMLDDAAPRVLLTQASLVKRLPLEGRGKREEGREGTAGNREQGTGNSPEAEEQRSGGAQGLGGARAGRLGAVAAANSFIGPEGEGTDNSKLKTQNSNPPELLRLDADAALWADEPATAPESGASPGNLVYVIYTSGSTGRPKGVLVEHGGLVNLVRGQIERFEISEETRLLQFASPSFDAAASEIFTALCAGATLVLAPVEQLRDGAALLQLMRDERISVVTLPPALLGVLEAVELPELRTLVTAGERCDWSIVRKWSAPGRLHINAYGPTEATIGPTLYRVPEGERGAAGAAVPIGRPLPNVHCYVLDEAQQPVPVGMPGELWLGGVQVARGYLNRPDLTSERFRASPYVAGERLYCTGDRVRWREDGVLDFLGRVDEQVKVRGFRIEPGEIESLLEEHPDVADVAVAARTGAGGEGRLIAYVVPRDPENPPGSRDLRKHLGDRLPEYMMPSGFFLLDAIPLTPNGKIDRRALPAPQALQEGVTERPFVAPRDGIELQLAQIWQEILGAQRIGVYDNFFERGGHSLLATQLTSRIQQALRVQIPLRSVFEAPTLAALARQVEEAMRTHDGVQVPPIQPVERNGDLPLSFAQQRLWFLDQLAPGNPGYNLPAAVRLTGRLDIEVLRAALGELIRRHESLRTVFVSSEGTPAQRILTEMAFELHVIPLEDVADDEREDEVARLAMEEAQRPFDLSEGPLIRASLLRISPTEHVALLNLHHIISDGWSMGVLIRELGALYQSFLRGNYSPLLPLPIQYADFAAWQRDYLAGERLEKQLGYWKEKLAGAPPLLELPTDRPRPAIQSTHGASEVFAVPPELAEQLRRLSRKEGVTLFMVLLGAWQALLARFSGQDDIVVGTPIAGRTRSELEGLIGFFVNTLVLRTDLSGNPSFRELLKRVRDTALGAYQYQDVPFEQIVDAVQPERNPSHTPLFQVMFALQNTPVGHMDLQGLSMEPVEADTGVARFELSLVIREDDVGGLSGALEYNTDLFDRESIQRMLGGFRMLLQGIAIDPEQPVTRLTLLSADERQRLLVDWNDTEAPPPAERCIHELVAEQAARTPGAIALRFEGRSVSYRDLDRRSNQLAHLLRARGVGPDVRVGVCLRRSPELVIALLGILKAGGAYLPLDTTHPTERLRHQLEDSGAALLITEDELRGRFADHPIEIFDLDHHSVKLGRAPIEPVDSGVTPGNLAYVIYTSGSTGRPKGAMIEHRGMVNLATAWADRFDLTPRSRVLQFASISFDASVAEIFMTLIVGAQLHLADRDTVRDVRALEELLRRESINTVLLTPSVLRMLDPQKLPELTTVISAAEACSWALARRWQAGRRFFNAYGPTETTVGPTLFELQDDIPPMAATVPIGSPLPNMRCYVLDEHGEPVPVGVPGELFIGGVQVARGYLNLPDLTAERFLADPFQPGGRLYRTGDRVRWLPDGNLEFLGRVDTQVKIRGFRIEPGEIESVLREHPGVREAAVVAQQGAEGETRLVAYVVPGDEALMVRQLRQHLAGRLPDHMVPASIVTLETLPVTTSGKLDRRAVPLFQTVGSDEEVVYVAPRDETEQQLVQIWQELLGVQRVGVTDSFFDLGGHSLLAVRLVAQVEKRFSVNLPLFSVFQEPTIEALAQVIRERAQADTDDYLVPLRSTGSRPPLFFIHPSGGSVHWYVDLAKHLADDQPFFGIQARGISGDEELDTSIEAMAAHCVEVIRRRQPSGPYHLGSWSLGVIIVYEVAQQLRQQGEEVALLVMLDQGPSVPAGQPKDDAEAYAELFGRHVRLSTWRLRRLAPEQQLAYVYERARKYGAITPDVTLEQFSRLVRLLRTQANAWRDHRPRTYPGRITLFRSAEQPSKIQEPDLGWARLAIGGVGIHTIGGDHNTMLQEPHVRELAAALQAQVDAVSHHTSALIAG